MRRIIPNSNLRKYCKRFYLILIAVFLLSGIFSSQGYSGPKEKFHVRGLKKGVFLVASPKMLDPNFKHTVILLVKYDKTGAIGVIVNRPMKILLSNALPEIKELKESSETLFYGGPVSRFNASFLLNTKRKLQNTDHIFDTVFFNTTLNTLAHFYGDPTPGEEVRVYAGYSGWVPGQLEAEIAGGGWLIKPADKRKIFYDRPDMIWDDLMYKKEQIWVHRMVPGKGKLYASYTSLTSYETP